jgi:hypothetical protein
LTRLPILDFRTIERVLFNLGLARQQGGHQFGKSGRMKSPAKFLMWLTKLFIADVFELHHAITAGDFDGSQIKCSLGSPGEHLIRWA